MLNQEFHKSCIILSMDHSISQGMLSNVIPKIENTKLPVRDFNEKVWKLFSP
jgi:hypothetical protein